MDITPAGGNDGGIRTAGGGDLHLLPPEHDHTINYDQANYEPVFGGGAETKARISNQWWDQEGVDVEGMQTSAWEAERT